MYGLDFLVDESFDVHLLEVNPGPDFKQTGERLKNVIYQLWEQTSCLVFDCQEAGAVVNDQGVGDGTALKTPVDRALPTDMTLVYSKEWSASKIQGGMKIS